ncbi:diaminopimelate epimerase [Bartonella bacilliformis Peru38]|uniref:Diaminopimelate epimerase n=2 Tax=Bartonella bacilliformis TaxID=774 RepID=DAPF_BARBK|nr:diaminopimelate epimerase [Bartonella bacilliformis]A1UQV5.1 RecName: Full=Diaminopimelate epimerase; Short=DAP epimerase; AltName: Full=PLP-independent amino acid racemase [Bartonella bacilliformis KC583]ABM45151.1 diaminopimelate epimerase [Bartonella bacilliformis KC583]AMG85256.1 diaminopimelate epimerase [Bartonella bacilliformis]EKS46590.1 diaminopimelate epimerase [Bartonella bacilliformis INS]EYS88843.1 diaminopimelate epimerase [Bartonella bacilliformis San Pedro600-02]EYS95546.1 
MKTPFSKMNGLGNKIIVADLRKAIHNITPQAIQALASNPQTHFDQIMAIHPPTQDADFRIEIWNADGSMAKACGNGTRCVIEWLANHNLGNNFRLETSTGIVEGKRQTDGLISVDMGRPYLNAKDMPVSREIIDTNHVDITAGPLQDACLVSVGNLHAIFFIESNIQNIPLEKYGPKLEHDPLFPERCNISIAQITSKKSLTLRTWERGAGLTQACGSAACASAVAAYRRGLTERHIDVNLPKGILSILYRDDEHIIMTGPTEHEFSGLFNPLTGTYKKDHL